MSNPLQSLASTVLDALAGRYTQHQRVLRLTTPAGDATLLAESLRGDEALGEGYRFEVSALSLDAAIPLKSLIGQPVLVELLAPGAARPFHGHVTSAQLLGANGGFARYLLVVEPWTAFLKLGRDSRIFQDLSVPDILSEVFKAWEGKGRLAPAWRFELRDPAVYLRRSIVTQYQESDLAFAERLMSEEGLFYFFEHAADAHTLVIADHNGAFAPNPQAQVRFTQPGAVMREDSVDRWRLECRLQTNEVALSSWDYRTRQRREVSASSGVAVPLASSDHPGVYAYATRADGERIAEHQLQALQASAEVAVGAGTVRSFAPGTTFALQDHSKYDGGSDAEFAIVRVRHLAHNNLNADTGNALARLLGACPVRAANDTDLATSLHAFGRGAGERPVYRNRFEAIPAATPYRSRWVDERGSLLHPRPSVQGQQSAIVVGPAGSVIHTDRDHRIKVQFHWQRGSASHSRLDHPSPDGHTGAPADDRAGTWVRVATPLAPVAGANWGSHALPRVGQEVLVDFLDGNIDRPVVIGALYNGAGNQDAQSNGVVQGAGAATGNAPAWFPGQGGAYAHPAVLSGLKSQALAASQDGAGAFSQLVFDDTPGEPRVALQRHAKAYEGTDELNLGHLRHQTDNQRLAPAGFGAELKTAHSAALRAAQGLLLSTAGDGRDQLDAQDALAQVEASHAMQTALAETAHKHNATLAGETEPAKLPALEELAHSAEVLAHTAPGNAGADAEHAAAFREPQLQLSSPKGIAALTPASAVIAAGATTSIAAGQDIDFAAQGNWYSAAAKGVGLFTYGKASAPDKPNQETGIALHAASGKVSAQSQSGPTRLTADKSITVASVTKSVTVAARQHVMLTAQGAWLKLEGGNIMIHGPGTMAFKASMKELTGPMKDAPVLPHLPAAGALDTQTETAYSTRFDAAGLFDSPLAAAGTPYLLQRADGSVFEGQLDQFGRTNRVFTDAPEEVTLLVGDGEWEIYEDIDYD
ncbi:type VI secretion system Vgr family protein [uncultured Massilia sp.]|uniref:type VI secretion system Vgr family protein n=1 Tax=uncultured Massilia sp. TaxID=169973 RepID=UPI00258B1F23|nr:type VI secretion system Vgr family protein [uncultured Massilia sp.]